MDLCEHFGRHLLSGLEAPPSAELEAVLARVLADGRAAWPEIPLSDEDFVVYAAERMPPGTPVTASLESLHAQDLFLACGCARGDAGALAAFERHHMSRLASYLSRADALSSFTDEVKQAVRVRLLVSEDGLLPRIASYQGRGPLAVWLRLAAARLAVNLRRTLQREADSDEDVDLLHSPAPDPELEFFRTHYRKELRDAVERALLSLPARDGHLLRLFFFEHLSADLIGTMNGVSARTAQRWLASIRARVMAETRRLLDQRFPMNQAQLDSVIALVGSQMELSISRVLGRVS